MCTLPKSTLRDRYPTSKQEFAILISFGISESCLSQDLPPTKGKNASPASLATAGKVFMCCMCRFTILHNDFL